MKETVKINLGGRLFDLDFDAYEKLKSYLDSLKRYYNSASETDEILDGIEERLADLLASKLSSSKEVVNSDDIQAIIDIMGTAEQIDHENGAEPEEKEPYSEPRQERTSASSRRLYRDPESSILGGVSSGLSAYLNIDSVWIRIAFVVLFFVNFVGGIIYIILWAVLPMARTTAQKLEMKGKPVNVDNIEREVKKEFGKVKDNFSNIKNSQGYQQTRNVVTDIFEAIAKVLIVFLKIIGVIIGISLLFLVLGLIISLLTGVAFLGPFNSWWNWSLDWPDIFFDLHNFRWFGFCIFLLVFIPVVSLFFGLIRWITGAKGKNKILGSFAATIWVLALVTVIVLALSGESHFALRKTKSQEYRIKHQDQTTLYLNLEEFNEEYIENYQIFNKQYAYDSDLNRMLRKPKINIKKGNSKDIIIEVERKFYSFNYDSDPNFGRRITGYGWSNYDSLLVFDEYFKVRRNQGWRVPSMEVDVYIPEDKTIFLDEDLAEVLEYVETREDYDIREITGEKLLMTAGGLMLFE